MKIERTLALTALLALSIASASIAQTTQPKPIIPLEGGKVLTFPEEGSTFWGGTVEAMPPDATGPLMGECTVAFAWDPRRTSFDPVKAVKNFEDFVRSNLVVISSGEEIYRFAKVRCAYKEGWGGIPETDRPTKVKDNWQVRRVELQWQWDPAVAAVAKTEAKLWDKNMSQQAQLAQHWWAYTDCLAESARIPLDRTMMESVVTDGNYHELLGRKAELEYMIKERKNLAKKVPALQAELRETEMDIEERRYRVLGYQCMIKQLEDQVRAKIQEDKLHAELTALIKVYDKCLKPKPLTVPPGMSEEDARDQAESNRMNHWMLLGEKKIELQMQLALREESLADEVAGGQLQKLKAEVANYTIHRAELERREAELRRQIHELVRDHRAAKERVLKEIEKADPRAMVFKAKAHKPTPEWFAQFGYQ